MSHFHTMRDRLLRPRKFPRESPALDPRRAVTFTTLVSRTCPFPVLCPGTRIPRPTGRGHRPPQAGHAALLHPAHRGRTRPPRAPHAPLLSAPSRHLGGTRAPSVLASATLLWLLREAHNTGCLKHASAYLLRPLSSTASPHFRWRRPCPFSLRPRHNAQDRRVISSGRVKRGCPSRAPSLVSLPLLAHLHLSPG